MDKAFWFEVIKNNYQLPEGESATDLSVELMNNLGNPDPDARDTIAYAILARWIIVYRYHTDDDLRAMIEWLVPNLSEGIGEQDTDTVFLRSYSALILSHIVYRNVQTNFLEEAEVLSLLDRTRHYLVAERDARAYVHGKGWANACAHTADLLKFLARSGYLDSASLTRLLDALAEKVMMETEAIFHHDEDDRLAKTALTVMQRNELNVYELTDWLKHFQVWKTGQQAPDSYNSVYHATHQNIRNFLRSLHTQIQFLPQIPIDVQDVEPELIETLRLYSL